jgi:hypothetical protein
MARKFVHAHALSMETICPVSILDIFAAPYKVKFGCFVFKFQRLLSGEIKKKHPIYLIQIWISEHDYDINHGRKKWNAKKHPKKVWVRNWLKRRLEGKGLLWARLYKA